MKKTVIILIVMIFMLSDIAMTASENYLKTVRLARAELWQTLSNGATSATVAVMDGDNIVYSETFGMIDRENGIPANAATQYNIGSTSKIFTAAAVLLLCEDGKINLDKPVITYLPDFKMADERYRDITVRMLLNHTSGMSGTNARDGFGSKENPAYVNQTMEVLASSDLKANPGEISVYCNDGFTVAQAIVAKVAGMSFADFLNNRIFSKAGMKNTSCFFKDGNQNIARKYSAADGRILPAEYVSIMGSGGIASTAVDLCLYTNELWNGKILNAESLVEYQKPQYGPQTVFSGKPYFPFGLGWDAVALGEFSAQGVTVLAKNGGTTQFNTQLYTAPKNRLTVVVSVAGPADVGVICSKMMQTLLEEKGIVRPLSSVPALPLSSAIIPKEILAYEGYYSGGSGFARIQFDQAANKLKYFKLQDGQFIETATYPYKSDGLFEVNATTRFGFTMNSNGRYLLFYPNGSKNYVVGMQMVVPRQPVYSADGFDSALWLQRNLSYYDLECAGELKIVAVKELPGYIDVNGALCRITEAGQANSDLPYSRDTTEIALFNNNGKPWLKYFAFLFSDSRNTDCLRATDKKIVIGADGYNEWRVAENDRILDCIAPEKSRLIVTTPSGEIIYDSLFGGLKPIVVAKGSFISFIGPAGATFVLK